MKLQHIQRRGRWIGPDGKQRNIHKAQEASSGWDVYFYVYRRIRVLIPENELRTKWKEVET